MTVWSDDKWDRLRDKYPKWWMKFMTIEDLQMALARILDQVVSRERCKEECEYMIRGRLEDDWYGRVKNERIFQSFNSWMAFKLGFNFQ